MNGTLSLCPGFPSFPNLNPAAQTLQYQTQESTVEKAHLSSSPQPSSGTSENGKPGMVRAFLPLTQKPQVSKTGSNHKFHTGTFQHGMESGQEGPIPELLGTWCPWGCVPKC